MILWTLILIPLLAAPLAWWSESVSKQAPRRLAAAALTINVLLGLFLYGQDASGENRWLVETMQPWIPQWGIGLHLALDGVSLVLVLLTGFLGLIAVIASWTEISERIGFFHFNLLVVLSGVFGVFLALDLFLFFVFWEVMLVPMYLLIGIWGHEQRRYAALKFFLFTQAGSLLLLVAIVALATLHARHTGMPSFDYPALLALPIAPTVAWWLMLGFFLGFAVKLPAVPFHTWLPDAHTEAPTGGSVILAGLLLKTGAYGLLRFAIPLFPDASRDFAPAAMALGVAGILYGGVLAFAQTDFKRLVAYSSVSHLGFALLGIYAMTDLALQGAVVQLVAHGVSTGALFMLAGALQERLHTRDMRRMGGLWASVPRLSALGLFFAVASLGLPGLANFVGEFLVLFGAYARHPLMASLAAIGMVVAAVYSLALVQRAFFGPPAGHRIFSDLSSMAVATLMVMGAVQVWLGWQPGLVLSTTKPAIQFLLPADHLAVRDREQAGERPVSRHPQASTELP
jgi:NADH-quinone oxidoreductase subunit M